MSQPLCRFLRLNFSRYDSRELAVYIPGDATGNGSAARARQMPQIHTTSCSCFDLLANSLFELGRDVSININGSDVEVIPASSSAFQKQISIRLFVSTQADIPVNQFKLFFHPPGPVRSYYSSSACQLGE